MKHKLEFICEWNTSNLHKWKWLMLNVYNIITINVNCWNNIEIVVFLHCYEITCAAFWDTWWHVTHAGLCTCVWLTMDHVRDKEATVFGIVKLLSPLQIITRGDPYQSVPPFLFPTEKHPTAWRSRISLVSLLNIEQLLSHNFIDTARRPKLCR